MLCAIESCEGGTDSNCLNFQAVFKMDTDFSSAVGPPRYHQMEFPSALRKQNGSKIPKINQAVIVAPQSAERHVLDSLLKHKDR